MVKDSVCKMQGPGFNTHLGTWRFLSAGKLCDSHGNMVINTKVGWFPRILVDSSAFWMISKKRSVIPPQAGLILRMLGDFQASYMISQQVLLFVYAYNSQVPTAIEEWARGN